MKSVFFGGKTGVFGFTFFHIGKNPLFFSTGVFFYSIFLTVFLKNMGASGGAGGEII